MSGSLSKSPFHETRGFGLNLTSLLASVETRERFTPGQVILADGHEGDRMYVIVSGVVEIHVGECCLERVATGNVFGELALIDLRPRSATVIAVTDCELVPVDLPLFTSLLQQLPFFAIHVMRILADRLRRTNQLILDKT